MPPDRTSQEAPPAFSRVLQRAGLSPELAQAMFAGVGEKLPEEQSLALIATDPLSIQATIHASRRLVTRLGASQSLADWDALLRERPTEAGCPDVPIATLFAGGGQGLLLVAAEDAQDVCTGLSSAFGRRALGHLQVVARPCSPAELVHGPRASSRYPADALRALGILPGSGGFGGLLSQLNTLKDRCRDLSFREGREERARCSQCGFRPIQEEASPLGERVCAVCLKHHRAGSLEANAAQRALDDEPWLAWLYLDGTGVGARFLQEKTLRGYQELSGRLREAFDWRAVEQDLRGADIRIVRPLVRGGDDLALVFPAAEGQGAFHAALAVLRGLERRLKGTDVGVGAGLVVTGALGARHAWGLAEQLVRSAKQRGRGRSEPVFTLDFELIFGGDVLSDKVSDMRRARQSALERTPQGWQGRVGVQHGARPYTLKEAEDLVRIADQIEALGRDGWGTLGRVEEAMSEDLWEGLSLARYLLGRQKTSGGASLWSLLGGQPYMRAGQGQGLVLEPHPEDAQLWRTALSDLLDLNRIQRRSAHV